MYFLLRYDHNQICITSCTALLGQVLLSQLGRFPLDIPTAFTYFSILKIN